MRGPTALLAILHLPVAGALAAGCFQDPDTVQHLDYPRGELSTSMVEFGSAEQGASVSRTIWLQNQGDLPMGLSDVSLGTDDRSENFSFSLSTSDMECPEGSGDTGAAFSKGFVSDSGGGGEETGSTTPGETGSPDDTPEGVLAVLDPECRVPIHINFSPVALGELYGSLILQTATEKLGENATGDPEYFSDPTHAKRIVYLKGEGERGIPNIQVSPRRYDYGHLWSGTEEQAYISIKNTGDGDLTVQEPYLDGCSDEFEITAMGDEGAYAVLEPGISTYVEITYAPEDTDATSCVLVIESDDEDSPSIEVDLDANSGSDPDNRPPTVVIRDPGVGYQHDGLGTLDLELNIFDINQPADSLYCRVKSMVLAEGASVAHCEAEDESGHIYVSVDPEDVGVGIDTIKVQVTDASEIISYASISVLWNAAFPESDDDGDGWGDENDQDEDGNYDCDDLNAATYPYAAEVADGSDNDCDGVIDEGTDSYDDDGDSFTEDADDCNDHDGEIYPGAWE